MHRKPTWILLAKLPTKRDTSCFVVRRRNDDSPLAFSISFFDPSDHILDSLLVSDDFARMTCRVVLVRAQINLGALDHEEKSALVVP